VEAQGEEAKDTIYHTIRQYPETVHRDKWVNFTGYIIPPPTFIAYIFSESDSFGYYLSYSVGLTHRVIQ